MSTVPTTPAPSQPAAPAQTSVEIPKGNVSSASLRQFLVKQDQARSAAPAEPVAPPVTAPVTPAAPTEPQATEPVASATPSPASTEPPPTEPPAQAETFEIEGEDVLSHTASLDPATKALVEKDWKERKKHIQEQINKRLGKITADKKLAEQQAAQYAMEMARLRAQVPQQPVAPQAPQAPASTLPLSEINDAQGLNRLVSEAKQTIRECDALLYSDGINNGVQLGNRTFSKQEIIQAKMNAQTVLDEQIPVRARFLQAREQAAVAAAQKFPFLRNPASPEFQEVVRLSQHPDFAAVRESPYALDIISTYVMSRRPAAPVVAPPPPPRPVPRAPGDQTAISTNGVVTPRADPAARTAAAMEAEKKDLVGKGNVSSASARAYLKKLDQSRQT